MAQDWGTALAFHLAARRPKFIRLLPTWDDFYPGAIETFQKFRTPRVGEEMMLEDNVFVEAVLGATARKLTMRRCLFIGLPFLLLSRAGPLGVS
jgi:haloalkane dehalogenase